MNLKIFFIVLINVFYVCSSPYLNHLLAKRTRYCGSHLTTMLSIVCRGHYASMEKKSYEDASGNNEYEEDYNDVADSEVNFPFLSKELANTFVPQKIRRQVVNECCKKTCSFDEMRYYCGN